MLCLYKICTHLLASVALVYGTFESRILYYMVTSGTKAKVAAKKECYFQVQLSLNPTMKQYVIDIMDRCIQ